MPGEWLSLETLQHLAHQYGYWTIFLGMMLENAGIPIPGETITLIGGFLAGSGELNYGVVVTVAIAGAVLGDSAGYWVGRQGGWPLLLRVGTVFRIPEAKLEAAKLRFSQNAAKAVFLGRFVALLRVFAGPLAGMARMPYPKFLFCNISGASLWALSMVTLAFTIGRLVPLADLIAWVAKFTVLALVLVLAWFFIPMWLETLKVESERMP
jgi:membrane protein DedA with SNARE-associated domain